MLFTATPASAQEAFERFTVSAGGTFNVGEHEIHSRWEHGRGGEVTFSTPFYLGAAEAGAALHRYEAAVPDVPRFDALLAFVGWGLGITPTKTLSCYAGFRVGTNRMSFDEETFRGVRNESELALGIHTRIDVHATRNVGLYVAGRIMRTYTAPRFETAYVSAGLSVTLDTPEWLRTILR